MRNGPCGFIREEGSEVRGAGESRLVLGRCGEHRAHAAQIRPCVRSGVSLIEILRGDADEQARSGERANISQWQVGLAQMYACRASEHGNVGAIVDEDGAGWSEGDKTAGAAEQFAV